VLVPVLSLVLATLPGNDTSGSVEGLVLDWFAGDPNSIVSDAAASKTKVTTFLIFVFMKHYGF